MKALLLNGERNKEKNLERFADIIIEQLMNFNYELENILLREKEIADCLGNFKCWTKTPGKCIIDDFGNNILSLYNDSDLLILLNPITFGGYSYQIKKALDRLIPVSIPIFDNENGDYFYKKRNTHAPALIGIGIMGEKNTEEEKLFYRLLNRNGFNLRLPFYRGLVFDNKDKNEEISKNLELLLKEIGDIHERS